MSPRTLERRTICRSCKQPHSQRNESCAEFARRRAEGLVCDEIELRGNTTSTRLRALRVGECEHITLETKEAK
jgi:hypothetical protein